jgi:hypothetical protein
MGRALIGSGIVLLIWAVLSFCNATIGGPPSELHFANRRSYTEIKSATHSAFLPLFVRGLAGMALLFGGSRLLRKEPDEA